MKKHKLFIGFLVSILIHLSFLMFFIKINIHLKAPKTPIYISTIKPLKTPLSQATKPSEKPPKTSKRSSARKKISKGRQRPHKIDYSLTIPSLKELTEKSVEKAKNSNSKSISKGILKAKTNQEKPKEHTKNTSKINPKPQETPKQDHKKPSKALPKMKPKRIDTVGSYFDILSYLEAVFHYIHQNCKGEGVAMFDLYKDGSLRLLGIKKGNVSCNKPLQAPPMPNSLMENKLQFLINIP